MLYSTTVQDMGSAVWAAFAPLLEDLGQAVADIPIGADRLNVLERCGGYMAHLLLCFPDRTDTSTFYRQLQWPRRDYIVLRRIYVHIRPYTSLRLIRQAVRDQSVATFRDAEMMMENLAHTSR